MWLNNKHSKYPNHNPPGLVELPRVCALTHRKIHRKITNWFAKSASYNVKLCLEDTMSKLKNKNSVYVHDFMKKIRSLNNFGTTFCPYIYNFVKSPRKSLIRSNAILISFLTPFIFNISPRHLQSCNNCKFVFSLSILTAFFLQ